MIYCRIYCTSALLNVAYNNQNDIFGGLDEEDIERIQEILDESDDDDEDDDVEFLSDDENGFPMPKKLIRKDC